MGEHNRNHPKKAIDEEILHLHGEDPIEPGKDIYTEFSQAIMDSLPANARITINPDGSRIIEIDPHEEDFKPPDDHTQNQQ